MTQKRRFKDAEKQRERGGFVPIPFAVLRSQSWPKLSGHAVKLMFDLLAQYRGDNNGDLCMAWTLMKERGWRSRDTLGKARAELLTGDWITITRQGGRHAPSLYAVTFFSIHECKGKLDVSPTGSPPSTWRRHEQVIPLKVVTRPSCQLPNDKHARRVTKVAEHAN